MASSHPRQGPGRTGQPNPWMDTIHPGCADRPIARAAFPSVAIRFWAP